MRFAVPRKRVVPHRSALAPAWGRRREDTSLRSTPPRQERKDTEAERGQSERTGASRVSQRPSLGVRGDGEQESENKNQCWWRDRSSRLMEGNPSGQRFLILLPTWE